MALTEHERRVLDFEREWWTRPGTKEGAIAEELGMSGSSYYRTIGELIDRSDAEAYDPLLVKRLRRHRARRRRARFEHHPADRPGR